jgi:hypothetical protein
MKPSSLLPWMFSALALVGSVSGCRCGDGPVNKTEALFEASPTALSFNACPSTDEFGQPVADVFPDVQRFTLANLGKVAGPVASITITGNDPDIGEIFSVPADSKPTSVEGSGQVEIPVRFSPKKKGDVRATLTLDDGLPDDGNEPVTVSLIGTGMNLPGQPTVTLAFEQNAGKADYKECDSAVLGNCLPEWPETFYGESSTLTFKVKSSGCPTLRITNVEMLPNAGQTLEFGFESGFLPPTTATPTLLNTVDGSELVFKVAFRPQQDPQFPNDGQRFAVLRVSTNDPAYPELDVQLTGAGKTVTVYASPTTCNFSDPNDLCGFSTKQQDKAQVRIGNAGTGSIKVKSLAFAGGGQGGRFSVGSPSVVNQVIPAGGTVTQEILHADAPLFVTDDLKIIAVDAVDETREAGALTVSFSGGRLPCLETEPADTLSFENPTTELTTKTVKIKNAATRNGVACGALLVSDVVVDDPNPFFSVVAPLVAPGTQVLPGTEISATVQYKKPISGGTQTGVLRVKTNDPDFGPEPWKVITLYSQSPLDQIPFAVIKGPGGQETQYTVSLGQVPLINGRRQIQVTGEYSYDPTGNTTQPVAQYQFGLTHKPPNAQGVALENNGLKTAQQTALLTMDPNVGSDYYQVQLRVFDNVGQASANIASIKIYVVP